MHENSRRRLASIAARWNDVEERLKAVEIFRREAAIAAVNELRYVGRRVTDALLIATGPDAETPDSQQKIEEHIIVAENYFANADHDLTDAAVLYVLLRVSRIKSFHGSKKLKKFFPEYDNYSALLEEAQTFVKVSRKDRNKRAELYKLLAEKHVPKLIELQTKIDDIPELYVADGVQRGLKIVSIIALVGSIASIISLIFSFWVWWTNPIEADISRIITKTIQQLKP